MALLYGDVETASGGTQQHQNTSSEASSRYSHSIVTKTKNMNSTDDLTSYYIYFLVRETVSKPELTRNSALSSTLARDSENERGGARGKWPGMRKRGYVACGRFLF